MCRCLSAAEGGQAFAARVLLREKNEDKKIEPLFGGGRGGEAFAARVVVCHFPKKPGALLRTQINHDKFDGHLRAHGVCTTARGMRVVSVGRGGQYKAENKNNKKVGIKRPGERGRGRASARSLKK